MTISAHKEGLLEERSLPFLATVSLSSHLTIPPWILLLSPLRVSASCSLRVTTAARQCVRKLECHVLTGVRGMLTGQTEGTDGGVTCPRSSGIPVLGNEGFETQRFCAYLLFSLFWNVLLSSSFISVFI